MSTDLGEATLAVAMAALSAGVREDPSKGAHRGAEVDKYVSYCVRSGALLRLFGVNWCSSFASYCVWTGANVDPALAVHWTPTFAVAPDTQDGVAVTDAYATIAEHSGMSLERVRDEHRKLVRAQFSASALLSRLAGGASFPPVGYRAAVSELVADARATGTWHDVSEGYEPELGDLCILGRNGEDPRTGGLGHVCIVQQRLGEDAWTCVGGNQGVPGAVTVEPRTLRDVVEKIVGWIAISTERST